MADERKYYVLCQNNCKFESMTKEQILAAIEQAVSTGEITDVDTGFVTKLKELNANAALSFWIGTSAQYNALTEKAENCFYIITDDTREEDLQALVVEQGEKITTLENIFSELPKHKMLHVSPNLLESQTNIGIGNISKYHLLAVTLKMNVLNNDNNTYTEVEHTALVHRMPNTTFYAADVSFFADTDYVKNIYFTLKLFLKSSASDIITYWTADPCGAFQSTTYYEVRDFAITRICGIC